MEAVKQVLRVLVISLVSWSLSLSLSLSHTHTHTLSLSLSLSLSHTHTHTPHTHTHTLSLPPPPPPPPPSLQGSVTVGIKSKTHVVLVALKRSSNELSSYQKKIYPIDDHVAMSIAGLTSDGRMLG